MRLGLQIELFRDNKIKQPFVQFKAKQTKSYQCWNLESLYTRRLHSGNCILFHLCQTSGGLPYLTESNANT